MNEISVTVNIGKELAEISADFTSPIEVVREAIHNAFDARATEVEVIARTQTLSDSRRVLNLTFSDNGQGMDAAGIGAFFGLGHSKKPNDGRPTIGYKGHGTKIYYQAQDIVVVTRTNGGIVRVAEFRDARRNVRANSTPSPVLHTGESATGVLQEYGLHAPDAQGTVIHLIDYTPDSSRLIDVFRGDHLENYIRWFTTYGSFEHVVKNLSSAAPFSLKVQGTDAISPIDLVYGHPWPASDATDLKRLKERDDRRPYNFFCKTIRFPQLPIDDGYRIDALLLFEGKRSRLDRDHGISRQRAGGIYSEEERYGLWLCKDFIPIENRSEWLLEDECPKLLEDLRRPLIFVNSQDFKLIANRGSVGNSSQQLISAVKKAVFKILDEVQDDKDIAKFLEEYQEDLFSRKRDKDHKALGRRIDRYNNRKVCEFTYAKGKRHHFLEPRREITVFGLIAELSVLDKSILGFDLLDYDDHSGIDMLVRRNGTPSNLLDKSKVAYVELKYLLGNQVNHAFDHLYAIVCWDLDIEQDGFVVDASNNRCQLQEHKGTDGVTSSQLVPLPGQNISHNVKVVVLRRFLAEKYKMTMKDNPNPIAKK